MDCRITLEADDPGGAVPQAVRAGIRAADPPHVPRRDWLPLCLPSLRSGGLTPEGKNGWTSSACTRSRTRPGRR